ncbi:MAG TPA: alpha/beta hydrolase-fold protein [Fimbriimonadaceae bacterium]|nr:alpha/beta hydrolase-fold protein [Fimbriimonadaceae bacterium]
MAVLQVQYQSRVLGQGRRAILLVPEHIAPPFHVLFQLHGLSDDETTWLRQTRIEAMVAGLPLLVVMPDGGRSFYADAAEGPKMGEAIGVELPELVDRWFPTHARWAIGGLSMGGSGSVRLALNYPERFVSVASHSGSLGFGHFYGWGDDDFGREFRRVLGPNPVGGPQDLFALAERANPRPAIRLDCGLDDFTLAANRAFHEHLGSLGYEHEYAEFPGDHTWDYWNEHLPEAIAFHRKNLGI